MRAVVSKTRRAATRHRFGVIIISAFAISILGLTAGAGSAWAEGAQAPPPNYVTVQQALSYLVNDHSSMGNSDALMKVNDALAAQDAGGVNLGEVREAKTDLLAGNTASARTLLQKSIRNVVAKLPPAVGDETGTTVMVAPFVQPAPLTGTGLIFLALSLIVAAVGGLLSTRLRPREGLRDLSRDILGAEGIRHHRTDSGTKGSGHDGE